MSLSARRTSRAVSVRLLAAVEATQRSSAASRLPKGMARLAVPVVILRSQALRTLD